MMSDPVKVLLDAIDVLRDAQARGLITSEQLPDMPDTGTLYLSPKHAASLLGCSIVTLRNMAARGEIEAIRTGAHRRYTRASVLHAVTLKHGGTK